MKGKKLSKSIKSQRIPSWPTIPTTDLPPKDVADDLLDTYLRTSETVYRILHVPSFKREYEALWTTNAAPNIAFVVQLKLVLAIGAAAYDETFSFRKSANHWLYEALTWLSEPVYKHRLDLQTLQTSLLALIAREYLNIGAQEVWVSVGSLYRRLFYMGMHRDPHELPGVTTFAAEMRRRIWNTTLEICLQSSMTSGCPPFISMDDFDTETPLNLDDEQLTADDPVPKPEDEYTDMSVAIALRKTFPVRLIVAKFLNNTNAPGTYEETLTLDTQLREAFKILSQTIQGFKSGTGPSPPQYAMRVVDFIMTRYISSIHIPFFGPQVRQATYAYSRKVVVESMVKIWNTAYNPTSTSSFSADHLGRSRLDDFSRLTLCTSGAYRVASYQASMLLIQELRMEIKEDDSLGGFPSLRPDLLAVLENAKIWYLMTVESGETNVKGHIFLAMAIKQIETMRLGLGKEEAVQQLIQTAEKSLETIMSAFERLAGQEKLGEALNTPSHMSTTTPSDIDWDFVVRFSGAHRLSACLLLTGKTDDGRYQQSGQRRRYDGLVLE